MPPDSSHFTQAQIVSCTYITSIKYKIIWYWIMAYFFPSVPVAHDLEWRTSFSSSPPHHHHHHLVHLLGLLLLLLPALLSWAQGCCCWRIHSGKKPRPTSLCPRHHCTTTPLPSSELTRIHVVLFIFVTHSVDLCKQMYYSKCSCVMKNGTPVKICQG